MSNLETETETELDRIRAEFLSAEKNAKAVLKRGDRVRHKCLGPKRVFTFSHWEGEFMVSKSGRSGYIPFCVDMVNGVRVRWIEKKGVKA